MVEPELLLKVKVVYMVSIDLAFRSNALSLEPKRFFLRNRLTLETSKPQTWQRASPGALSTAGLCQLPLLVVLARP
jgi:hypothetical protein